MSSLFCSVEGEKSVYYFFHLRSPPSKNNPAITGFEIIDKNAKPSNSYRMVRVEKSEFADMAQKSEMVEEGEREIVEAATVNIVRVSFEENINPIAIGLLTLIFMS